MPRFRKIKETCLYVTNIDRCRDFYEGKLGLKCFRHQDGRHVFFEVGDDVLLCFVSEDTKKLASLPAHCGEG